MATLRASLSLNSVDVLSTPLSLTTVANILCDTGSLTRAKILGVAAGSLANARVVYKANDKTEVAILFVRNLSTEIEKYMYLHEDQEETFAKIPGGSFALIPVNPAKTIYIYGTDVDQIAEYGVFGLDSSAVALS
jgi:hypothetical protein